MTGSLYCQSSKGAAEIKRLCTMYLFGQSSGNMKQKNERYERGEEPDETQKRQAPCDLCCR